jgi:hypothetical protein
MLTELTCALAERSQFDAGDQIVLSGFVDREIGRSWPKWMRRIPERINFFVQNVVWKIFRFRFGPQKYRVIEVSKSQISVR